MLGAWGKTVTREAPKHSFASSCAASATPLPPGPSPTSHGCPHFLDMPSRHTAARGFVWENRPCSFLQPCLPRDHPSALYHSQWEAITSLSADEESDTERRNFPTHSSAEPRLLNSPGRVFSSQTPLPGPGQPPVSLPEGQTAPKKVSFAEKKRRLVSW